jgi:hypothetical protein
LVRHLPSCFSAGLSPGRWPASDRIEKGDQLTEKPQATLNETLVINNPKDCEPEGPDGLKWATGSSSHKFNNALLDSILAATWCPPGLTKETQTERWAMAVGAVAAFKPQDEIEGMIAAQAVAMHLGAMECLRRAMRPDQPGDAAARLRKDGASLARGVVEMVAALDRKRGKIGNQVVRVEHVTVQAGGQAIVGNVAGAKPGGGDDSDERQEPRASPTRLAHDPPFGPSLATLRGKDPERVSVPIARDGER